jgi:hypothetical protein
LGKKSAFIRTPKFNLSGRQRLAQKPSGFSIRLFLEILLAIFFGMAIVHAIKIENYSLLLFHLMLFFGFSYVVIQSLGLPGLLTTKK